MKIATLLEVTAQDLFRKITGLDAMIDDPATTDSEKQNARNLKQRLQDRLSSEFPGAKRSQTGTAGPAMHPQEYEFWTGMARAAQEMQDLADLKKNNLPEYQRRMLDRLKQMKSRLATMRRRHVPGNVDTANEIQSYARDVDRFIRTEFPDMWAELKKKRNDANLRGYENREKNRQERNRAGRDAVKREQKLTFTQVGKAHETAIRELYNALKGTRFRRVGTHSKGETGKDYYAWQSGRRFLIALTSLPTGAIRTAWNQLPAKTQQDLRTAIDSVNTQGYNFGGYTAAQKLSLLNAMTAYKDRSQA